MKAFSGFSIMNEPWVIFVSLLVGIFYAVVLYTRKSVTWHKKNNIFLGLLRFLLTSIITYLLLSPFIKFIKNVVEEPVVVFAVDNSESVALSSKKDSLHEIINSVRGVSRTLEHSGMKAEIYTLSGKLKEDSLKNLSFKHSSTNLSSLLDNITQTYENRNLTDIILLSDGIHNQGTSPAYKQYNVNIHTVGMGDTSSNNDIIINNLYYNKIANAGNKFPIVAEIKNKGFKTKSAQVLLKKNGNILQRKNFKITENKGLNRVKFLVSSNEKGMVHYTIKVVPLKNEFSKKNNTADAYIDIIESKNKVLLVAPAPHPDIKALRKAITRKKNQKFVTCIPGIHKYNKKENYDLVIFHQIPNKKGIASEIFQDIMDKEIPVWYIAGLQTDYKKLSRKVEGIKILQKGNQIDNVTTIFNSKFDNFKIEKNKKERFAHFPPVMVPFGDFKKSDNLETALFQTIGNINNKKPLLIYALDASPKKACFFGDGLWKWRMNEYSEHQNTKAFDALITKTIQLISEKKDKRKFRFYPENNEYYTDESITFKTEVYNDIYEKVYGNKVNVNIKNQETGKSYNYNFIYNQSNEQFEINGLSKGIYKYTANTMLDGKRKTESGTITIKELQLEYLTASADHNLLKNVAENTNGKFYNKNELKVLQDHFLNNKPKSIMHSQEEITEIINLRWIFYLLTGLVTIEWFFRKYWGGY